MQSKLLKQTIIFMSTIVVVIILTAFVFKLLTNMTKYSPQMQLVINILKFEIIFGIGSSITLSTRIFFKNLADNVRKIEKSKDLQN